MILQKKRHDTTKISVRLPLGTLEQIKAIEEKTLLKRASSIAVAVKMLFEVEFKKGEE